MNQRFMLFLLLCSTYSGFAQINPPNTPDLFKEDAMPRIDIFIDADSLAELTDVENNSSSHEYVAKFVFNNGTNINDTVENIGFKLRGNGSRDIEGVRKSYRVSFNSYEKGRKFHGFEKINIKATQDESFLRPKIAWHVLREMGFPAAWVSHVQLYVNNDYWGIFTIIEHFDENFVKRNFGNNDGNFYKCRYPSSLSYISSNPDDYKLTHSDYFGPRTLREYDLKINEDVDDYTDLMQLIDALNNTSLVDLGSVMKEKINIPQLMKFFALEVYLGHWDSYSGNGNNYYLYNNEETGKFEYLTTDFDFSIGVWFPQIVGTTLDIYNWFGNNVAYNGPQSIPQPPLRHRLLEVDEFKSLYTFYLKQVTNSLPPDALRVKAEQIQNYLYPFLEDDPSFTFSESQFFDMLDNCVIHEEGNNDGVIEHFENTYSAIRSELNTSDISPMFSNLDFHQYNSGVNSTIKFSTEDEDEENLNIEVFYRVDGGAYNSVTVSNSTKGKLWGQANHEVVLSTSESGNAIDFYITATDSESQSTTYPAAGVFTMFMNYDVQGLFINECMTSNDYSITDEHGNRDDWIEIFNANEESVDLANVYLTDEYLVKNKWQFPDVKIGAGEFAIVWADKEEEEGDMHANFKLSSKGETLYMFSEIEPDGYTLLDSLVLPEIEKNVSFGRYPDGANNLTVLEHITPGHPNNERGLAFAVFQVDMSDQIASGDFNPETNSNIDVVGNFNNWEGSVLFADDNGNGRFTYTKLDFAEDDEIEFKFRIDQDDSKRETVENRTETLIEGCNNILCMFNGGRLTSITPGLNTISEIELYPNPVTNVVYISSDSNIEQIQIFNLSGEIIRSIYNINISNAAIDINNLESGLYIIKLKTADNVEYNNKFIKQ